MTVSNILKFFAVLTFMTSGILHLFTPSMGYVLSATLSGVIYTVLSFVPREYEIDYDPNEDKRLNYRRGIRHSRSRTVHRRVHTTRRSYRHG